MQSKHLDKGVNLGNWLVLEKWMSPELFDGTSAEDEYHLWRALDETARRERFKVHRDAYITDRDFAYLASKGIDFVRLPVPFFVFGDYAPYVGCIDYLDKAFRWGERHHVKILIDLHTVPDSQNGFDNGGICGVCKFHKNPEHVEFALSVLERLAARYRRNPSLWGIEVLNEPVSPEVWNLINVPKHFRAEDPAQAEGSEPVPTEFLKRFYMDAYDRIRAQADDVKVVFHDGFRIKEWVGFIKEPDFKNVVVDTHMYLVNRALSAGDADLDVILAYIASQFGGTVKEMSQHFPVMVGEWCIDPYSKKAAALVGDAKLDALQRVAAAHLNAWEGAAAWCYWSYKLHVDDPARDMWDLLKAIELGFMPAGLSEPQAKAAKKQATTTSGRAKTKRQ
jgi:glucan 1,3-beta-glucosidase